MKLKLSQAQTQRDRAIAKQAQHDRRLNEATRSQNALAKAGEKFVLRDVLILATALAIGSYLAFILLLKLQIQVWPTFITG